MSYKSSAISSESQPESQWESLDLTDDLRWQLARRIAASSSFARSALLSKFLLYVCERALNEKTAEINEHQIGVHAFGRRPGYNPSEDNIVRNYARQLRQRLDHYFETEGKQEELILSIPRGKYVPHFKPNRLPEELTSDLEDTSDIQAFSISRKSALPVEPVSTPRYRRLRPSMVTAVALVLLACGVLVWVSSRRDKNVPQILLIRCGLNSSTSRVKHFSFQLTTAL